MKGGYYRTRAVTAAACGKSLKWVEWQPLFSSCQLVEQSLKAVVCRHDDGMLAYVQTSHTRPLLLFLEIQTRARVGCRNAWLIGQYECEATNDPRESANLSLTAMMECGLELFNSLLVYLWHLWSISKMCWMLFDYVYSGSNLIVNKTLITLCSG